MLYIIFVALYPVFLKLVSLWHPKAKLWLEGRRHFPQLPFTPTAHTRTVWMHCASLGEFEQGRPVMEQLKKQDPSLKMVLTFFSPSGYEVQKNYAGADAVFYLPMDSQKNAAQFIAAIQPSLVLWVKYDYWFYYLRQLHRQQIPVVLISAIFRPQQPFFKWYGGHWKKMLAYFEHIFVQDAPSQAALNSIGINQTVSISGDTRFDRVLAIAQNHQPLPLIAQFCGDSQVLVAGSTWKADETLLHAYFHSHPDKILILAPHEIDGAHIKELQKNYPSAVLYSTLKAAPSAAAQILIIDNVGMLSSLYQYATVAYIGGGFGKDGVHNVLEAAVYGKPVLHGPVYQKYAEAIGLVNVGGAMVVSDNTMLEKTLNNLFSNQAILNRSGKSAKDYVKSQGGATQKTLQFIQAKRLLTN